MATIYTSLAGERELRDWCRDRLHSWSVRHQTHTLRTSLGSTTVVSAGRGRGVLLLPGTNFAAATSLEVAEALLPDHRVFMPDLPGQPGLSAAERPGRGRLAAYGRWVAEVVDQLNAGPVVLVGHSLGAAVALAAEPGPHISGLLLVSAAGLSRARLTPALMGVTLPWVLAPTAERSRALLRHLGGPAHKPGDELVEWMTLVARHSRTSLAPSPLPASLVRRWQTTPVVVVTGEEDCFYPPARLRRPALTLLGTDVVAVPELGHLGPHEDPALLPALLDDLPD